MSLSIEIRVSQDPHGGMWHAVIDHGDPTFIPFTGTWLSPGIALYLARVTALNSGFVAKHFKAMTRKWEEPLDACDRLIANTAMSEWVCAEIQVTPGAAVATFQIYADKLGTPGDPITMIAGYQPTTPWAQYYLANRSPLKPPAPSAGSTDLLDLVTF